MQEPFLIRLEFFEIALMDSIVAHLFNFLEQQLFRCRTPCIQTYQSSPIGLSGRPAHCPFRGLLGVHSRCGLHTRAVTVYRDTLTRGFSHFVTSMTAPVASGLERLPGGT